MKKRLLTVTHRTWILLLFLFAAAWSPGLLAQSSPQSQFIFPHFLYFSEEDTGIAVFNPNRSPATVYMALFGPDGLPVTGVTNPVSLTVPAGGQMARTASELFGGSGSLDGTLVITSMSPGLIAYYQTFDPSLTFLDGSDAPLDSTSLVFPVIPGQGEGISEIDLVNPNGMETSAELKLWSFDGTLLATTSLNLPAGVNYRNLTQAAFPAGTNFSGASHITVTSKPRNVFTAAQSLMGTSLFVGFSSRAQSGGYVDWAALNALALTQVSNSGVLPYFRTGDGYATTLSLVNMEPAAVTVTVTAIGDTGDILGVREIQLSPQGGLRQPLQSVIEELGSEGGQGWILVQASGRITGAAIFGREDDASLTAVPLLPAPKPEFVFPQVVQGYGLYTEITLVNPTPYTSNALITVVYPDGTTHAAGQVDIGPNKRVSLPLDQILPELGDHAGGVVHVSASEALFATAVIWSESGSIATAFIPQGTTFYPEPLTHFAVTGKVYLNGQPADGVTVVLSGPVDSTVTTGGGGSYKFTELPAGRYSMMVDQTGFQFIPDQFNFEIVNTPIRQDFQGFTNSDSILILPATIPVGSPDTTLAVYGGDFNTTSEVFISSVRLESTFINESQLQAIIPSYMLASAATYNVAVITDGTLPSRRVTQPFALMVYQNRPVLQSLDTEIILAGSSGRSIILRGSGFLQGARVKVNASSAGIEVNVIDATEIRAYLPSDYFQQGGIYPIMVENPYPANVASNIQLLTVYYPPPAVESLVPLSVAARLEDGAPPVNIEVIGYGFRRGAVVLFNETPLVTTYCESNAYCLSVRLYAQIPAELLRSSGFAKIEVSNPAPSLANSQAWYLRIDGLQPTITSVLPGSAMLLDTPFEYSMPVVVYGTNFSDETMARIYRPDDLEIPSFSRTKVEVLSSTQLVVSMTVAYPVSLGEWLVEVANPAPGGGVSDAVSFFITEGTFVENPFLISLSPQTVAAGGPSFTLTINGTNFKAGSEIYFNYAPLVTTVVSDRQVRALVPAALIQSAGRVPISVTNPDTGGTSNRLFLDIR